MSKSDVIKKLTFLAAIGAAIGALVVFLKKRNQEDFDIFEEDDDEDILSCPGCQEAERNYTTISKEAPAEEASADKETDEPEEASLEETNDKETTAEEAKTEEEIDS